MSISRPWLAAVLVLFCLPLFVGLNRGDVQDDEAIYSFGVDRLLESGDWLAPKSSPHEDAAFLEKPPLKFWIVGLPIHFGLLPHNEFGLRFWDALFGAVAFLYVFAIGSRLAGAVCGAGAVLILFVHWPLLFEHGLRTNNMEAALFLCYCGGVFHYLEWMRRSRPAAGAAPPAQPAGPRRASVHAYAAGLYFVLGFMTKFVAAVFLPAVLGLATVLAADARSRLLASWRVWSRVLVMGAALIAPWFVYAQIRFGAELWRIILGAHVVERFTAYLDPAHLQPWYFYPVTIYLRLADSGAQWLVLPGLALLMVQTIRRRWFDGLVVLLWIAVPLVAISFGTSKLYHYAYPFLPPVALAGGYAAALVMALAPVPVGRALRDWNGFSRRRLPRLTAALGRPAVRAALLAIAGLAIAVAAYSILVGPVRVELGDNLAFRSSGVFRPAVTAIVAGVLAGAGRAASRAVVLLLVASLLPLPAYRESLERLEADRSPKRAASDCLRAVQASAGLAPGLYVNVPGNRIGHPVYYYFRRVRPWTRVEEPEPGALGRYLSDPAERRPALVWEQTYQDFRRQRTWAAPDGSIDTVSPPMVPLPDDVLLLLPGPYAICGEQVQAELRRR